MTLKRGAMNLTTMLAIWALIVTLLATSTAAVSTGELNTLIDYLRAGDNGLVRPGPSDETFERQTSGGCAKLDDVLKVLTSSSESSLSHAKALEYVVLCTANQPTHREQIGQTPGALEAVLELVQSEDPLAAANAGEAIWILSFHNVHNHGTFLKNNAVEILGKLIMKEAVHPHVQMWALAALQNLMASYCETETGHCWWHWNDKEEFVLDPASPLTVDGEPARAKVLKMGDLVETLVYLSCHGPSDHESQLLPGEGDVTDPAHRMSPNIVTWAATGAVKNLILNAEARDLIRDDEESLVCLCMLMASLDWLEKGKAEDALFHLGLEESCHLLGEDDEEPCVDIAPWVSDNGELTCGDYEPEEAERLDENGDYYMEMSHRACNLYGNVEGTDGYTAKEACCFCGGGHRDLPDMEPEL